MIAGLSAILAVMLLTEPDEVIDAAAAAAISEDANRVEIAGQKQPAAEITSARITSRSADLDRKEGGCVGRGVRRDVEGVFQAPQERTQGQEAP